MQVPWFSPRISLIEMAPCLTPRSGYPGRPAVPCLSPQTDIQTPPCASQAFQTMMLFPMTGSAVET